MIKQGKLRSYATRLRKRLASRARDDIGIVTTIFPAREAGAVFELQLNDEKRNAIRFKDTFPTVNKALKKVDQHAFGGNLDSFVFKGVNIIGEPSRIIIIKGEDGEDHWNDAAVDEDFKRILELGRASTQ